ncbi:patatin-like phospholipase family protein [Desulfobotulus sp.]|uniref:patatin-like phospholipase family protein n=1 Tax=Desulfobotulus sp. TaxID=1940337 RepID=UPI002A362CE4|nr:patatin-like phospholipase family protein [Desulfobotulus sp.]MDY0164495.1 patatin-like phospholipase family protein [Desulfobotulus sp.]
MDVWGHLGKRYATQKPRKLLALDGGGIRGIITLKILERMESLLRAHLKADEGFRLCQYFDYIGGTSTGAIIASGLARGMSVAEIMEFYQGIGARIFTKAPLLRRFDYRYISGPLEKELQKVFPPEINLRPEHLQCLLLVVMHNRSTDSPWPISSNPLARYNFPPDRPDCNLKIPLWELVRASTAAPVYFPSKPLCIDPDKKDSPFVFVDGGVTPYNNPAFLLFRMATQPPYCLNWPMGEKKLLLVSVGTGSAEDVVSARVGKGGFLSGLSTMMPQTGNNADRAHRNLFSNLIKLPGNLMYASSVDQDINCRTIGHCRYGMVIDRELGDLIPGKEEERCRTMTDQTFPKAFSYLRYDADLSPKGLEKMGLADIEAKKVQPMDCVKHMGDLLRIGGVAAGQVERAHFNHFDFI